MSEHIHADIVRPDGTVADIDRTPSTYWKNGAPAPRAMKQPRKQVLREALRAAADRIEAVARERDAWRELAEREPTTGDGFLPMSLLAIGFVIGAAFGWLL